MIPPPHLYPCLRLWVRFRSSGALGATAGWGPLAARSLHLISQVGLVEVSDGVTAGRLGSRILTEGWSWEPFGCGCYCTGPSYHALGTP